MVKGHGYPNGYPNPLNIYMDIHTDDRVELSVLRTVTTRDPGGTNPTIFGFDTCVVVLFSWKIDYGKSKVSMNKKRMVPFRFCSLSHTYEDENDRNRYRITVSYSVPSRMRALCKERFCSHNSHASCFPAENFTRQQMQHFDHILAILECRLEHSLESLRGRKPSSTTLTPRQSTWLDSCSPPISAHRGNKLPRLSLWCSFAVGSMNCVQVIVGSAAGCR